MLGDSYDEVFRRDILIEAQAEIDHDGSESLRRISIPVLILAGENDNYFPQEFFQRTVDFFPGGKLHIYPGKGHNILDNDEAAKDIIAWVAGESI